MDGSFSKFQRMSRREIEGSVADLREGLVRRVGHPLNLPCYLLTYFYSIEIINIPPENLDASFIVNCFNQSLTQAVLEKEDSKSEVIISEGLDVNLRLELFKRHLLHLNLSPYNMSKVKSGNQKVHMSGMITHGGVHDGNKTKVMVRMKEGSAGKLSVKWNDGYFGDGKMKLVSGNVFMDAVLLSGEEAKTLQGAGYEEYDLYHQVISSALANETGEGSSNPAKKRPKRSLLSWISE